MTRQEIRELLPFRANGTLTGEELAAVEAALAGDAGLRAELEALMALRETMQAEEVQSPGEFGLARLLRDVQAERQAAPAGRAANVVPITRLRVWQAAAAVVLAAGLGFNLLQMPTGPAPEIPRSAPESAGFSLASGGGAADFTVAFSPDATEAEIRALLLGAGLEIVSGPSALGLYGLGLLDSDAGDAAFEALSGSGIVEDVQ